MIRSQEFSSSYLLKQYDDNEISVDIGDIDGRR